jgi:hypothetical protein
MNGLDIDTDGVNLDIRERDELLSVVDNFINYMAGVGAEEIEDTEALIRTGRQRMGSSVSKMDDLKKQLADGSIDIREFNTQIEQLSNDYTRDLLSVTDLEDKISIFNWAKSEVPKMVERRIRGLGVNDESVLKPLTDEEIEQVDKKISSQIKKGIARRLEVLQKYIDQRYSGEEERSWEQMTPEIWDSLRPNEKEDYLQKAYSHKRIVGSNGIIYNAEADISTHNGYFVVNVVFNEIDSNGRAIRQAGSSERYVWIDEAYVENKYMWLGRSSPIDKGAGIQTIYNQHAFMYLNQIGINRAHVATADDGPYVWARIGFKQDEPISSTQMDSIVELLDRYRAVGPVGLIGSDAEYRRILALYKMWENGSEISHQDFIFAFDSSDKFRALRQKEWFRRDFGLAEGILDFAEQYVTANPGREAESIAEREKRDNARIPIDNGVI